MDLILTDRQGLYLWVKLLLSVACCFGFDGRRRGEKRINTRLDHAIPSTNIPFASGNNPCSFRRRFLSSRGRRRDKVAMNR